MAHERGDEPEDPPGSETGRDEQPGSDDTTGDDTATEPSDDETEDAQRCDFCRQGIPLDPVHLERDGVTYTFCSPACKDALLAGEYVHTTYHGGEWFETGVSGLDSHLPQGVPRNSFVLLSGAAGTRVGAVQCEMVWRTLQRGEPAVWVTFQEPPGSVVQQFLTLDWNVIPYLDTGRLHILDAFTARLSDPDRMAEQMNDWNRHLYAVAEDVTTTVRDPSDLLEIENKLDNCLTALDMSETGLVLIDSLTELGTLVQPIQAYDFVKDVRADVCKGRFVPIVAGATFAGETDVFPHDMDYNFDGVVDLELNGKQVEDTLIKRIRVRKLSGALAIQEWSAFEYTRGTGMVTFDPEAEIAKARAKREAAVEKRTEESEDGAAEEGGDESDSETEPPDTDGSGDAATPGDAAIEGSPPTGSEGSDDSTGADDVEDGEEE